MDTASKFFSYPNLDAPRVPELDFFPEGTEEEWGKLLAYTEMIAVGTALASGPPRRSQRALLAHWAPALGAGVKSLLGVGVHDLGGRQPSRLDAVHPLPVQARALAATP